MLNGFRRLPKRLRFALLLLGLNVVLFTLFRLIFYFTFQSTAAETPAAYCFYLGLKFDLRIAILLLLPFLALSWIPRLNVPPTKFGRWFWSGLYTTIAVLYFLLYIVDLGHYAYVRERLNASVIDYVLSPDIATRMVGETYPVGWAVLATVIFGSAYGWTIWKRLLPELDRDGEALPRAPRTAIVASAAILALFALYGKLSWYPLRWSDAYFSTNSFAAALSTNPVHFIFDTLHVRESRIDPAKAREVYDLMADYLEVQDRAPLNFAREIKPEGVPERRPNIVVIFLESFASYKTGLFGNRLNPTPHFDAVAEQSILFNHFFVPKPPTARSIFTAITGIPDLHPNRSASRNPRIIHQHTIVRSFEGYDKMYFIGGSASWGNIRGIVANNIPDARIYEEGDYGSPRNDVWGVSDLHLFEEANKVLRTKNERPFFAFIQTAGNHRPFTIPDDNRGFQRQYPDLQEILSVGFDSTEEYNGIRYMDHSIGFFFREAAKEAYFQNTIFVMFGDHGTVSRMPIPWETLLLTSHHVPLVLYAPGLKLPPRVIETTASSLDVLPTLAGMAGVPYLNTTLGRDLFRPVPGKTYYAFIEHEPYRGILDDKYFYRIEPDGSERLFSYRTPNAAVDVAAKHPDRIAEMRKMCWGFYHTAMYMLHHNQPRSR